MYLARQHLNRPQSLFSLEWCVRWFLCLLLCSNYFYGLICIHFMELTVLYFCSQSSNPMIVSFFRVDQLCYKRIWAFWRLSYFSTWSVLWDSSRHAHSCLLLVLVLKTILLISVHLSQVVLLSSLRVPLPDWLLLQMWCSTQNFRATTSIFFPC